MPVQHLLEAAPSEQISLLWSLPFILLLAAIALMPFINRHWWEKKYPWVALGLGAITAGYYLLASQSRQRWVLGMEDYLSFIILLGSLYIVSGGIVIHVGRKATPLMNCALLLLGAVMANFFGTTGASMLLIRPYLRMNRGHLRPFHVVFFIFLVSNVGGLLTPVGDPPLFLGYLNGVPFWWVLEHCRWMWATAVGILIVIFFILDTLEHGRAERHTPDAGPAVSILGIQNLLFIALIVWAVFQPGFFEIVHEIRGEGMKGAHLASLLLCREMLMVAAVILSLAATGKTIHERNHFTYAPIREVAILFVGIFSTMVPALQWLNVNAHRLPVQSPGQFYFTSGALSSVLDNAPTYLTFLEMELGKLDRAKIDVAAAEVEKMSASGKLEIDPALDVHVRQALTALVEYRPQDVLHHAVTRQQVQVAFLVGEPQLNLFIVAISLGSVLFGACTYIGNGPNFMVKSIADAAGAHTPGFLAYILRYTLPILLPVYILIWAIFLMLG